MKKYLRWYFDLVKKNKSNIVKINLNSCDNWINDKKNIRHKSNLFFRIVGTKITKPYNREVGLVGWHQPLLEEVKFGSGLLGMIVKTKKNKNFFLIQAKFEPGNINKLQISPTVQSTFSNIKFTSGKTPFLDYFVNKLSKKRTILKKWVSEDGGRFLKKKNLIHIIKIPAWEKIILPENFIWIEEINLAKLNLYKEPIVNPHIRSILSCTGYFKGFGK